MAIVFQKAIKPPTGVLLACLLLLICATLAMAVYIQQAPVVPNPEISGTWKKFLHGLSSIKLCAQVDQDSSEELKSKFSELSSSIGTTVHHSEDVSVTVLADVKVVRELTRLPNEVVAVTGTLHLGDWSRLCYNAESESSMLSISFVVSSNLSQTFPVQTCVILSGPVSLLPLSRPSAICIPPLINATQTKFGRLVGRADDQTIFNLMTPSKDQCSNGTLLSLSYDSSSNRVIYLSPAERKRIMWNLEVVSLTILILCVAFIIFRLIASQQYVHVQDQGYAAPQRT